MPNVRPGIKKSDVPADDDCADGLEEGEALV